MIDEKTVAERELERHRPQMLYAEHQLVKAGAFEAAAGSLLRRSRRRQIGLSIFAVLLVVDAFWNRGPAWFLVWAGVMLAAGALDHSHTKRTLETIRRLKMSDGSEPA